MRPFHVLRQIPLRSILVSAFVLLCLLAISRLIYLEVEADINQRGATDGFDRESVVESNFYQGSHDGKDYRFWWGRSDDDVENGVYEGMWNLWYGEDPDEVAVGFWEPTSDQNVYALLDLSSIKRVGTVNIAYFSLVDGYHIRLNVEAIDGLDDMTMSMKRLN